MEIVFERTGQRRYGVTVRRRGHADLRMDPAPGYDEFIPHDLQHLVVEQELGIADGIYGRLARGGTAATFRVADDGACLDRRERRRQRKRLARRERQVGSGDGADMARSEASTLVALCDWLEQRPEAELRARGAELAPAATDTLARMAPAHRSELELRLDNIRARLDEFASHWVSVEVGESITISWPEG